MIIVGTNSYISLEEANEIMETLVSDNNLVKIWDELSDSDKEAVIINSTEKYDNDSMEYIGIKKDKNQSLQFPRILGNNDEINCPYKIKKGLLIQGISDLSYSNQSLVTEQSLKMNGIKQFSDGSGATIVFADASESSMYKVGSGIDKDIFCIYFADYSNIGKIHWI